MAEHGMNCQLQSAKNTDECDGASLGALDSLGNINLDKVDKTVATGKALGVYLW